MYASFTGLPTKGRLFCSSMIERTLNGRQRSATPSRAAISSTRMIDRYEYVLPIAR